MRILFDHQVFSWQTYGGISRYFFELGKGLQAAGETALFPENIYSENVYMKNLPGWTGKSLTNGSFKGKKWLQERLGRRKSIASLKNSRADVFHPTYFDAYFLETVQKLHVPFVVTIHDMIHEIYGHGSQLFFSLDAHVVAHKRLLAEHAAAVVAVSENTKRDVLKFIPSVDPDKIQVIHHGNSMTAPAVRERKMDLPDQYLLFVGQRGAYKNFYRMTEQLAPVFRSNEQLHLVCAGGSDFLPQERQLFCSIGIEKRVLRPAIRSDSDLAELYTRASCFIFPSLYEGFGIPVLEAFACNCPVVLHAASSLPEVGGDAVLYYNDQREESLPVAVNQLLNDSSLRTRLIELGRERLTHFSWERSVGAHKELYRKIQLEK